MYDKQVLFHDITTQDDIDTFIELTNGLHDGYLIGIQYEHHGITPGNPLIMYPEDTRLKIKILITSINNAVVELVFSSLSEWQIKDSFYQILDISLNFNTQGKILWADDILADEILRNDCSYVIADKMKWRFIEI